MPEKYCCVRGCNATCKENILHCFPNLRKDKLRFNYWKQAIGGPLLLLEDQAVFDLYRVCHAHFDKKYHTWSKRLTLNSVPTLKLSGEPYSEDNNDSNRGLVPESHSDDNVIEDLTYVDSPMETEESPKDVEESDLHVGYKCNMCESDIKGFRYVCVQCLDWDMCGGCEARGAHGQHYVLRLPGPRPQNEIHSILDRVRRELMGLTVYIDDRIKKEIDDEYTEDPLHQEVDGTEVVNTSSDLLDEQLNEPLIFEDITYLEDLEEETNIQDDNHEPSVLNIPSSASNNASDLTSTVSSTRVSASINTYSASSARLNQSYITTTRAPSARINASNISSSLSNVRLDVSNILSTSASTARLNVSNILTASASSAKLNATYISTTTASSARLNASNILTYSTSSAILNVSNITTSASSARHNASNTTTSASSARLNSSNITTSASNARLHQYNITTTSVPSVRLNASNITSSPSNIRPNMSKFLSTCASTVRLNVSNILTTSARLNATNILTTRASSARLNGSNITTSPSSARHNASNITTNSSSSVRLNASNITTSASSVRLNASNITTSAPSVRLDVSNILTNSALSTTHSFCNITNTAVSARLSVPNSASDNLRNIKSPRLKKTNFQITECNPIIKIEKSDLNKMMSSLKKTHNYKKMKIIKLVIKK